MPTYIYATMLGCLCAPQQNALGRPKDVCVFSMGFPPLCSCLKAPFSLMCCVSCPLCLPLFSSAHPITAQWLIACLASKSQCLSVCGREKWWQRERDCESVCVCVICEHACLCVCLGFASHSQWPWMEPWLHSNHWHTPQCNWEDHTHTHRGGWRGQGYRNVELYY